jgi:hypothetical protein
MGRSNRSEVSLTSSCIVAVVSMFSGVPHWEQNLALLPFSLPHEVHRIADS